MKPADYRGNWEEFKKAFRDYYILAAIVKIKKKEFSDLKQGNKSVMEYAREFNHLAQYAPDLIDTDEKKQEKFLEGLTP